MRRSPRTNALHRMGIIANCPVALVAQARRRLRSAGAMRRALRARSLAADAEALRKARCAVEGKHHASWSAALDVVLLARVPLAGRSTTYAGRRYRRGWQRSPARRLVASRRRPSPPRLASRHHIGRLQRSTATYRCTSTCPRSPTWRSPPCRYTCRSPEHSRRRQGRRCTRRCLPCYMCWRGKLCITDQATRVTGFRVSSIVADGGHSSYTTPYSCSCRRRHCTCQQDSLHRNASAPKAKASAVSRLHHLRSIGSIARTHSGRR